MIKLVLLGDEPRTSDDMQRGAGDVEAEPMYGIGKFVSKSSSL
jgi:hypothetical protein